MAPADLQFQARLDALSPRLSDLLAELYPEYDRDLLVARFATTAAESHGERPAWLRKLDRQPDLDWFLKADAVGAVAYVDRFAGTLKGVGRRIDHLQGLGVSYLHLMPLLAVPEGENDGGYAVADYRSVRPDLGSMKDLSSLARKLDRSGIRLCLDFVLNHTAASHPWARAAVAGDPEAQALYWMFEDEGGPARFQPHLREIFPERGPVHFHWIEEARRHVWTTFFPYQWDLNFSNPETLRRMAGEMLFLANQGVRILRLDAVPFLWKQAGTDCENRPEAHLLIRVLNLMARLAAPCLVFKSEAIVHPDQVRSYVRADEAQLSYHPQLMALLWESLATRDTRLLRRALQKRMPLPPGCGWATYVRSHDDIGWGFADEDAHQLGIDPVGHRSFLNDFYHGRFRHPDGAADFAQGVPFGENPRTGDARVAGTTASLAGLERAGEDPTLRKAALDRIALLYGISYLIGGMPLVYLGDEIGQTNDYGFRDVPAERLDSRWVHRPRHDWPAVEAALADPDSPAAHLYRMLGSLQALRASSAAFAGLDTEILDLPNDHVFAFRRIGGDESRVVVANMTEHSQAVQDLRLVSMLGAGPWMDAAGDQAIGGESGLELSPYQLAVLVPNRN